MHCGDTNQISAVGSGQTLSEFMKDPEIIRHKENIVILEITIKR